MSFYLAFVQNLKSLRALRILIYLLSKQQDEKEILRVTREL